MKKAILLGMCFVMVFMFALGVQGAWSATLNTPAASGVVAGAAYEINCTWAAGGDIINVTNATITVSSANTANSTTTTILTNDTVGNATIGWAANWVSTNAEDGTAYIFTCNIYNQTSASQTTSDTSTGCVVDNTVPVVTYSGATPTNATSVKEDSCITIYASSSNAIQGSQTLTVLRDGNSWQSYTPTDSSNSASQEVCGLEKGKEYTYYYTFTDGTNSTTGASRTYTVESGFTGGSDAPVTTTQSQKNLMFLLIIGVVVLVIIGMIYYYNKK
jgi:hypothetical protein